MADDTEAFRLRTIAFLGMSDKQRSAVRQKHGWAPLHDSFTGVMAPQDEIMTRQVADATRRARERATYTDSFSPIFDGTPAPLPAPEPKRTAPDTDTFGALLD